MVVPTNMVILLSSDETSSREEEPTEEDVSSAEDISAEEDVSAEDDPAPDDEAEHPVMSDAASARVMNGMDPFFMI